MLLVQPGALLEPAYPDLRAYFLARPVVVLAFLLCAALLALLLNGLSERRQAIRLAPALLALVFLIQPLFAARVALLEYPDYQLRGQMWDFRDAQIRQLSDQGQRNITVQALDSWARITELQANPNHWVNNCAADYYGVDSIIAVEPILNPPLLKTP
jgi:hypothetical protein